MAVNLSELAKTAKTTLGKRLLRDIARESNIWAMLPISTIDGLKTTSYRYNSLPTVGKRALNGSFSESTGRIEPVTETLHIYGTDAKVDVISAKAKSDFAAQLQLQADMIKDALNYTFAYDFILGNHGVDPNGLEGQRTRVTNGLARYDVNLENGGASLDVLNSTANANTFLNALHYGKRILGGVCNAIFCNERTAEGIGQTLRFLAQGNLLSQTQDAYERTWDTVMGAKLVDVGYTDYAGTAEIIANNLGTYTNSSELYMVRMGDEEGLNLIQMAGTSPEPYDPLKGGEMDSQPAYLRRINWAIGLKNMSRHFSIVRIRGFNGFDAW